MLGSEDNGASRHSDMEYSTEDFLRMARSAARQGQQCLAAHLYIAAYEQDCRNSESCTATGLAGLRKAWSLACDLKDRPLAEHIYERLRPHSSPEANAEYAKVLQQLGVSQLKKFGLTDGDIEKMSDLLGDDGLFGELLSRMEAGSGGTSSDDVRPGQGSPRESGILIPPSPFRMTPYGQVQYKHRPQANQPDGRTGRSSSGDHAQSSNGAAPSLADLVGYDRAKENMQAYGMGMVCDERYKGFLQMLSHRHGINALPATKTMVFRSPAREDATCFMQAVAGELGMPIVRMYIDDGMQSTAMLCMMASEDLRPRGSLFHAGFDKPVVFVLEDIDLWADAFSFDEEGPDSSGSGQIGRGAREALVLIRMAVESSDVTVLASCSADASPHGFFAEMFGETTVIDIEAPDCEERGAVWRHAAVLYPSLANLDMDDLVRLSEGMTRVDIYSAAREAVEQAYAESLDKRAYAPVTADNLYDKIAAYQPLDSEAYAEIEDLMVERFRSDLENIDDLLEDED